jgi:hypothetical protein
MNKLFCRYYSICMLWILYKCDFVIITVEISFFNLFSMENKIYLKITHCL